MKDRDIVRKLSQLRPKATVAAISRAVGLPLTYIDSGAFRAVYRIGKSNLVVKLPTDDSWEFSQ